MSIESREADLARIKAAVESLGEHFSSVQILATKHDPEAENGTVSYAWGSGDWFARYGVTNEWITQADERAREMVRKESEE